MLKGEIIGLKEKERKLRVDTTPKVNMIKKKELLF